MRLGSYALAFAFLGLAAPVLVGCPPNSCFLTVCVNGDCRCSISTCGDGAAFDISTHHCRCLLGYFSIAGRCLSQQGADSYCGLGHHWVRGGCLLDQCRPGDELDLSTGLCLAHDRVNQVATNIGVQVGQGQKLGCPAGQKLIIDGNTAACVPLSQTCARDETWTGQVCAKVAQCPTGSIWNANAGQCVQYATGTGSDGLAVNVTQWAYGNFGPDGGAGTPAFCGSFSKKPWSFGIVEGSTATVRVAVMMSFPNAEIAKGVIQTVSVFDASGNPVPAKGGAEIETAAKQIFGPLVQGGGRSATSTATTTVKCPVINAGKPQPIPATGGL